MNDQLNKHVKIIPKNFSEISYILSKNQTTAQVVLAEGLENLTDYATKMCGNVINYTNSTHLSKGLDVV